METEGRDDNRSSSCSITFSEAYDSMPALNDDDDDDDFDDFASPEVFLFYSFASSSFSADSILLFILYILFIEFFVLSIFTSISFFQREIHPLLVWYHTMSLVVHKELSNSSRSVSPVVTDIISQ